MNKLKVLVVDDASFIRDLIKRAIRGPYPNFQIEDAVNGRRAQSLLKSTHFDLVLCDWEMPEMSGLELLQWFRTQEKYEKTPFMMVTSRGDKGHVVEAVQAGVSEYIGKPFSNEQLLNKLAKLVHKFYKIQPNASSAPNPSSSMDSVSALTQHSGTATTPKAISSKTASAPVAAQSASLLTGASSGEQAMTAAAPTPKRKKGSQKILGQTQIRLASGLQFAAAIKDINLTEVLILAKRSDSLPLLFEQAVMDIETSEGNMERINTYVHMVQSNGVGIDANSINVLLKYVDQDPEKLAQLSKFIASVR